MAIGEGGGELVKQLLENTYDVAYPGVVAVYLTGKELRTAAEIDASVSDFMTTARLYCSGLNFTYNPHRLLLNKVTDVYLVKDGQRVELQDDKLYRIVADLYSGQMLSAVTDMSYGILSIVPKYADGTPIEDFEDVILTENGKELKGWDAIARYMASFEDTDGDGNIDVYGFGGWPGDYFMNFVMSNGSYVAATATENLSSPEVGEVLQFIQDLNLVDKVMYPIPEENGWDVCRFLYRDGKVAFTPIAAWIMDSNKDYAFQHPEEPTLDFDMVFIPWPVGPHGNAETNAQKVTANACYVIPVGVEDPELVYNVLYDLLNWYNYDPNSEDGGAAALAIRDDPETLGWWYGVTAKDIDLQDYNFEVMMEMGRHQMLDRYGSLGDDAELPLREFINGDYTTAQLQEKYRQTIQDAIDGILGK